MQKTVAICRVWRFNLFRTATENTLTRSLHRVSIYPESTSDFKWPNCCLMGEIDWISYELRQGEWTDAQIPDQIRYTIRRLNGHVLQICLTLERSPIRSGGESCFSLQSEIWKGHFVIFWYILCSVFWCILFRSGKVGQQTGQFWLWGYGSPQSSSPSWVGQSPQKLADKVRRKRCLATKSDDVMSTARSCLPGVDESIPKRSKYHSSLGGAAWYFLFNLVERSSQTVVGGHHKWWFWPFRQAVCWCWVESKSGCNRPSADNDWTTRGKSGAMAVLG